MVPPVLNGFVGVCRGGFLLVSSKEAAMSSNEAAMSSNEANQCKQNISLNQKLMWLVAASGDTAGGNAGPGCLTWHYMRDGDFVPSERFQIYRCREWQKPWKL